MINQLVSLGEKLRDDNTHDALSEEYFSTVITIDKEGTFLSIKNIDKRKAYVESIQRTSGKKSRLLFDKSDYAIGLNADGNNTEEQYKLFLEKLKLIKDIKEAKPIFKFYYDNNKNGINKITKDIFTKLKDKKGNIAFLVHGKGKYIHEEESILSFIKNEYDNKKDYSISSNRPCSVCANTKYHILESHQSIKNIPNTTNPKFISYNASAFESYNTNSNICEKCANNYVIALNMLLSKGSEVVDEKTNKKRFIYDHRKDISNYAQMLFWLKDNFNQLPEEIKYLEHTYSDDDKILNIKLKETPPNIKQFRKFINSPYHTKKVSLDDERFYSMIITGEQGRIAVRSFLETSVKDIKNNIKKYFKDIAIYSSYEKTIIYPSINELINSSIKMDTKTEDIYKKIIGEALYNCALSNKNPHLSILGRVLKRIGVKQSDMTPSRASLIKLILNRNLKKEERKMNEKLDADNKSAAYNSGRVFATLEIIQKKANDDKDINSGIRERFYSSASTTPAEAFGRLLRLSQNHLSKLYKDKSGLAIYYEKELQEIFLNIKEFPNIFSLEEQGQFAIGYYHEKQKLYTKKEEEKENE